MLRAHSQTQQEPIRLARSQLRAQLQNQSVYFTCLFNSPPSQDLQSWWAGWYFVLLGTKGAGGATPDCSLFPTRVRCLELLPLLKSDDQKPVVCGVRIRYCNMASSNAITDQIRCAIRLGRLLKAAREGMPSLSKAAPPSSRSSSTCGVVVAIEAGV